MKSLNQFVENINSKEDFLNFLEALIRDNKENPSAWENDSLLSFLEGMYNWSKDMEVYYQNTGRSIPEKLDWKIFADILCGARVYE